MLKKCRANLNSIAAEQRGIKKVAEQDALPQSQSRRLRQEEHKREPILHIETLTQKEVKDKEEMREAETLTI